MERTSKLNVPKVSIVMPCYNQEKYLDECLKSVVDQTLRNIEIIIVDDGSTDRSLAIMQKYAAKDKRIKIISKPNSGYGHTMNVGIDAATGEYVGIVETDDYIEPKMFQVLYETAKKSDAEVVRSDFYWFSGDGKDRQQIYGKLLKDKKYYNKVLDPKDNPEIFDCEMMNWTGIHSREFLNENKIRHNETPGASYQDNGFWFQIFCLTSKLYFLDKPFYHYRQDNPNSSINNKAKVFCACDEYDFIYNFLSSKPELKKIFIGPYYRKKCHNYMFTNNRVSPKYKDVFVERFGREFKKALVSGDAKKEYFTPQELGFIKDIIKQAEEIQGQKSFTNKKLGVATILLVKEDNENLKACLNALINQELRNHRIIVVASSGAKESITALEKHLKADNISVLVKSESTDDRKMFEEALKHNYSDFIHVITPNEIVYPNAYSYLYKSAEANKADVLVFPMLAESGYVSSMRLSGEIKTLNKNIIEQAEEIPLELNQYLFKYSLIGLNPAVKQQFFNSSIFEFVKTVFKATKKVFALNDRCYMGISEHKDYAAKIDLFTSEYETLDKLIDKKELNSLKPKEPNSLKPKESNLLTPKELNSLKLRTAERIIGVFKLGFKSDESEKLNKKFELFANEVLKLTHVESLWDYQLLLATKNKYVYANEIKIEMHRFENNMHWFERKMLAALTTPKISVILPVYNVAPFLRQCLDSIVNQTFKSIEIICIDDGSTDDSYDILREYAQRDHRFIIIRQENAGAGAARNRGLEVANGEYLSFLDSDDFFAENMLEIMYNRITSLNAEIAVCRSQVYNNIENKYEAMPWSLISGYLPHKEIFSCYDIKKYAFLYSVGWAWDKLYKASFVRAHKLHFPDFRTSEDAVFVLLANLKANRIVVADNVLVTHRMNIKTSLSQMRARAWKSFAKAIWAIKADMEKSFLMKDFRQAFLNWALHFSLWNYDTLPRQKKKIHKFLRNKLFKELKLSKYPPDYFVYPREYEQYLYIKHNVSTNRAISKIYNFFTWPIRMVAGFFVSLKDNGLRYTLGRVKAKFSRAGKANKNNA